MIRRVTTEDAGGKLQTGLCRAGPMSTKPGFWCMHIIYLCTICDDVRAVVSCLLF